MITKRHKDPLKDPSLSSRDRRGLELARRQAIKSTYKRKQVGVILVKGRKIIAEGYNVLSHPMYKELAGTDELRYWSLHAEMHALARTGDVRSATAYLYGFKHGIPGNSKPCPLCDKYLRQRGIKRVVFTKPFGEVGELVFDQ